MNKNYFFLKNKWLLLAFLFSNIMFGATITSTSLGGNWNNSSSWIGGVIPTLGDDVVIESGATITVNGNFDAKSLKILGVLLFDANNTKVTLPTNATIIIISPGKIDNSGSCTNNREIFIGLVKYAACQGQGNNGNTFADINLSGGTGSASSNSPLCAGDQLVLSASPSKAKLSSATYTYRWSGMGISNPVYSSSGSYVINNVNVNNHGGVYTVEIRRDDGVVSTVNTEVKVNAIPKGGAVYDGNAQICLNSTTGNMTLGGDLLGSVVRWEKRLNSGIWNSINNSSIVYSENPTVSGTWQYRAVVGNGSCSVAYSQPFTVVVNPELTIALANSNSQGCQNSSNSSLSYTATTGNANRIKIDFNAAANTAGVQDLDYAVSTGPGTITIQYSYGITPGVYNGILTVVKDYPSCTSSITYPITLTISSSSTPVITTQPISPAVTCSGNGMQTMSVVATGTSLVYQWRMNGTPLVNGSVIGGATTSTLTLTNPTSTNVGNYDVVISSACASSLSSNTVVVSVISTPLQKPLITSSNASCSTAGNSSISNYNSSSTYVFVPPGPTVGSSGVVLGMIAGTSYKVTSQIGNCSSVSSDSFTNAIVLDIPEKPSTSIVVQPTCAIATGSFTITNYNASYTYTFSPSIGISRTNDLVTASAGNYTIVASSGSCTSESTTPIEIKDIETNTWIVTGGLGAWDQGTPPNKDQHLIFAGNYDSTKDVIGCDCTVNSGANVVFKYVNPTLAHTLTVTNDVKVLGSGKLTFENNASLVQTANSTTNTNSGKITYQRQTSPYKPFDYIYWSSPVVGQILGDVSPLTPLDKFYSFDVSTYDWKQEDPNLPMTNGVGYIIRGANYVLPTPPGLHQASFFGIPNNGLITVPIPSTAVNSESSALLGNPYPSALDANEFLRGNSSILEGTLYFWTHNTAIQNVGNITNGSQGTGALAYTSDDYATYNLTGGVTVVSTGNIVAGTAQTLNKPSGKIASGQSFFAGINSVAGTVKFENSMRVGVGSLTGNNTQFFRTAIGKSDVASAYENHRVWLNLTNTQGAFKQLLVGYITGATNAYDSFFDGVSFNGNEFVDFYSITDDETLTIQGRALPFDENDSVPLGYSSAIEGDFSISIDEVDGLLVGQNIYLEDKLNNSIHNLTKEAYTFETSKGTFDDRFVLRYTDKTLGTGDFDTTNTQVLVSVKNKQIKINSSVESIDKVLIFDILGKQIFSKINVGATELVIPNLGSSEQVLIIKTLLQNGQTVTTKLIY